jgi:hypothetical protein
MIVGDEIKSLMLQAAALAPHRPAPDPNKTYEPHIVIIPLKGNAAIFEEFSYKEDAINMYLEVEAKHPSKIMLAKVVRQHGEG